MLNHSNNNLTYCDYCSECRNHTIMLRSHRHFIYEYFCSFFHSRQIPQSQPVLLKVKSHFLLFFFHKSQSQCTKSHFPASKKANPSSHFTSSRPSEDILRELTQCVTNIFLSVNISAIENVFRVWIACIRLCKHRAKVFYCFYRITLSKNYKAGKDKNKLILLIKTYLHTTLI